MGKIKVLVLPSDRTGVSKFRSVEPHMKLQQLYGDEFHVDIITAGTIEFDWEDDSVYKNYDIVHFHRAIPKRVSNQVRQTYLEESFRILDKLKSLGIVTVMDLDDYWAPTKEHPAYQLMVRENLPHKIKENLKRADFITTTTPIFAEEIRKYNKNVIVLPNAIDPSEKQFTPKKEETDKDLRFGWLGGSSHFHDLKLMSTGVSQFLNTYKDRTQFVLCGFDTRGNITEIDRSTGQQRTRPIKPQESVWSRYEEMFTNNLKLVTPEYSEILTKYDRENEEKAAIKNDVYRRVWTEPITSFAANYNLFDVSMAPLKDHTFNLVKSQLKVIEAGFHKKALIAQDFGPYQIDCVNLIEKGGKINENGNAILVEKHKNHKDWFKAMKKLIENPELVDLLQNNLYNTVKERYHIDTVTKKRAEFYKSILQNNEKEVQQLIEETNAV
jgi:glycosyltransferase involved in cell wall biosynthesis